MNFGVLFIQHTKELEVRVEGGSGRLCTLLHYRKTLTRVSSEMSRDNVEKEKRTHRSYVCLPPVLLRNYGYCACAPLQKMGYLLPSESKSEMQY